MCGATVLGLKTAGFRENFALVFALPFLDGDRLSLRLSLSFGLWILNWGLVTFGENPEASTTRRGKRYESRDRREYSESQDGESELHR